MALQRPFRWLRKLGIMGLAQAKHQPCQVSLVGMMRADDLQWCLWLVGSIQELQRHRGIGGSNHRIRFGSDTRHQRQC